MEVTVATGAGDSEGPIPILGIPARIFTRPALGYNWNQEFAPFDVMPDGQKFLILRPALPDPQRRITIVENWFAEFRGR